MIAALIACLSAFNDAPPPLVAAPPPDIAVVEAAEPDAADPAPPLLAAPVAFSVAGRLPEDLDAILRMDPPLAVKYLAPYLFHIDLATSWRAQTALELVVGRAAGSGIPNAPVAAALQEALQSAAASPALPELNLAAPLLPLAREAAQLVSLARRMEEYEVQSLSGRRSLVRCLGLVGNDAQVQALVELSRQDDLRNECLAALRMIGAAASRTALHDLTGHGTPEQRRAAALSLGLAGESLDPTLAQSALERINWMLENARAQEGQNATQAYAGTFDNAVRLFQARAALLGLARTSPEDGRDYALRALSQRELRATAMQVLIADAEAGAVLEQAYAKADGETAATLLEILAARQSARLGEFLSRAAIAQTPALRFVAARLGNRPIAREDLFHVAANGPSWYQQDALRTFLDDAHAAAIAGQIESARNQFLNIADNPVPSWARVEALEGLGRLGHPDDAGILEHYLPHPELGEAAGTALARLKAAGTRPEDARETLEQLAATTRDPRMVEAAAEVLAASGADTPVIARAQGYLLDWRVIGPFSQNALPPFDPTLKKDPPPRLPAGERMLEWSDLTATGLPATVNLADFYEGTDEVAWATSRITLPEPISATFEVAASGGASLWVDGREIGAVGASSDPGRRTRINTLLEAGVNRIVLRVLRANGDWRYCVRLTDRQGRPIDLAAQRLPDDGAGGIGLDAGKARSLVDATP